MKFAWCIVSILLASCASRDFKNQTDTLQSRTNGETFNLGQATQNSKVEATRYVRWISGELEDSNYVSHDTYINTSTLVHELPLLAALGMLDTGSLSFAETVSMRNSPQERLIQEPDRLRLKLDYSQKLHRKLIPKFCYVVIDQRNPLAGFGKKRKSWGHTYGGIFFVLQPHVKDRSIWKFRKIPQFYAGNWQS